MVLAISISRSSLDDLQHLVQYKGLLCHSYATLFRELWQEKPVCIEYRESLFLIILFINSWLDPWMWNTWGAAVLYCVYLMQFICVRKITKSCPASLWGQKYIHVYSWRLSRHEAVLRTSWSPDHWDGLWMSLRTQCFGHGYNSPKCMGTLSVFSARSL